MTHTPGSPLDIHPAALPSVYGSARPSLRGHIKIARFDHWAKNIFVLPGILLALFYFPERATLELALPAIIGFLAVSLTASSNYVINELLDAPFDQHHQIKRHRPIPSGQVHVPLAYLQWIALMLVGMGLALRVSLPLAITVGALWLSGCLYNIPPIRTKDLPYVDVLSESINNPIRMIAGWYITVESALPPVSMLMSYWMIGAFFMAVKRFAEYREIGDKERASKYRASFRFYNEQNLLVSIMFYACMGMLVYGAFIMRYRLELILSFPFISVAMAMYLHLAFRQHSPVQHPEHLHRVPLLMAAVCAATVVTLLAFYVDMPFLYRLFPPTNRSWSPPP